MRLHRAVVCTVMACAIAGCGDMARQSVSAGTGPNPTLLAPSKSLIPTVNIAPAKGWSGAAKPVAALGTTVVRYAGNLMHPRWLYVLPNGDVLVAETNAPPKPEDGKGIKGQVMKFMMRRAGAGVPSANRITLLRDSDGDGIAELRTVFIEGLNSPFGMALVGNQLYVANTDSVVRFVYEPGQTKVVGPGTKVADLPGGPLNHHWTKNIVASPDGSKLYASVGSNSNAGENGIDKEEGRAAIWEIDLKAGTSRVFATGLRNPVGMAFEPETGRLWAAVNERDELGSDLVPDYMTSVRDGGFYGWPYAYYGQHVDDRVQPQRPDLVAQAIVPDYALGPHTASLGLVSARGNALPEQFRNGMFVGQHGSWNRKPRSGYRVIFVPFAAGKPTGAPIDVLTGFVNEDGDALGRPVGVAIDSKGALLVADDVGNAIWRVTAAPPQTAQAKAPRPQAMLEESSVPPSTPAEGLPSQAALEPMPSATAPEAAPVETPPAPSPAAESALPPQAALVETPPALPPSSESAVPPQAAPVGTPNTRLPSSEPALPPQAALATTQPSPRTAGMPPRTTSPQRATRKGAPAKAVPKARSQRTPAGKSAPRKAALKRATPRPTGAKKAPPRPTGAGEAVQRPPR